MAVSCQLGMHPNRLPISAGTYLVRAVDWAGNEDTNLVSRSTGTACPEATAPADGGAPADAASLDQAPSSTTPAPDAASAEVLDAGTSSSDGCTIGRGGSTAPLPLALIATAALLGVRRRRR